MQGGVANDTLGEELGPDIVDGMNTSLMNPVCASPMPADPRQFSRGSFVRGS